MDYDELEDKIINQMNEKQVNELGEILLNTQEQCQMVENLIKNQIQVKDALINKIHEELEYYKKESADRFIDQVMKAIIKLRKDMSRQIHSTKWNEISADELRREYTYTFEDLSDLLEQQNVDAYQTESGESFNAAIHQAKLESTNAPQLNKKIKQSISEGYRKGEKILIPEKVVVYQYRE